MSLPASRYKILRGLLAASAVAAVPWWASGQLIAPFLEREREARRVIDGLQERVEGARKTIAEVQVLEQDAGRSLGELHSLQGDLPSGSAMVWFPDRMKGHFAQYGIAVAVVRLNMALEEPGLPGYQRVYWSVALPVGEATRSVTGLLLAVAEFEQQNSFVKVLDFSIQPDPEHPGGRVSSLNVSAIVPK